MSEESEKEELKAHFARPGRHKWITDTARIDRYMAAFVAADIAGADPDDWSPCMNDPVFYLKFYAELAFEAARAVDREAAIEKEVEAEDRADLIKALRNQNGLTE
jgi:hypothetical protein